MTTKPVPPKPTEEQYRNLAISVMRDFAPPVRPCKKCGYPYAKGYCCGFCGDSSPGEPPPEPKPEPRRSKDPEQCDHPIIENDGACWDCGTSIQTLQARVRALEETVARLRKVRR